jgi:hypothetical protein
LSIRRKSWWNGSPMDDLGRLDMTPLLKVLITRVKH